MNRYLQLAPLALLAHGLVLSMSLAPALQQEPVLQPLQELLVNLQPPPARPKQIIARPRLEAAPPQKMVPPPPEQPEVVKAAPDPAPAPLAEPPVQQVTPQPVEEMVPEEVAEPVKEQEQRAAEPSRDETAEAEDKIEPVQATATPLVRLATPLTQVNPPPAYPRKARRRGLQGEALLKVQVDSMGQVAQVELANSSGYAILDKAAVKAIWKWRFQPGSEDGVPVSMWVLVPVKFQLK